MREPEKRMEGHSRKKLLELESKQALFQKRVGEMFPSLSRAEAKVLGLLRSVFYSLSSYMCVMPSKVYRSLMVVCK